MTASSERYTRGHAVRADDDLTIAEAMLQLERADSGSVNVALDAAERELASVELTHPDRHALEDRLNDLRREVYYRRVKSSDVFTKVG